MTVESWLTIAAILFGPITALMMQRVLDHLRERRQRRLAVFRTLMATRGNTVSTLHVEALNQIDVEFYGSWWPSHKKVVAAWRALRNQLNDSSTFGEDAAAWNRKVLELRVSLLHEMGRAVGYEFEQDDIQRNIYVPGAHGDLERDQLLIRKGVIELLTGNRALSTFAWLMPPQSPYPIRVSTEIGAPSASSAETIPPEQKQPLTADGPLTRDQISVEEWEAYEWHDVTALGDDQRKYLRGLKR